MPVVVTLAGLAKFAAAAAEGGAPLVLSHIAVGDGNGAAIVPAQTMLALVNERHRVAVQSAVVSLENPNWLEITATVPGAAGPWWVREIGLFDSAGTLIAIGSYPETYKAVAAEGVVTALEIMMILVVSSTANIQVSANPDNYATREWVIARKVPIGQLATLPFVPVKSFGLTAPPANPATGDLYAIPAGATGAWAGHAQRLAEWSGTAWTVLIPPDGHLIGTLAGKWYKRAAGVYTEISLSAMATEVEHLAGESVSKTTNPAGVMAMLNALRTELLAYINGLVYATGNVSAAWGQMIWCDTTAGPITVTLPKPEDQPAVNKRVPIEIFRMGPNAVTVARNGQPIAGLAENFTIDRDRRGVRASYVSTSWRLNPDVAA